MDITQLLHEAVDQGASDIFIVPGRALSYRKSDQIYTYDSQVLMPNDTKDLIQQLYNLDNRNSGDFRESGDDDFSVSISGLSRFRVSAYRQRGSYSAVVRVISFSLPDPSKLSIPESVISLGNYNKGMILVTGPAGSGKSTTLACIIDYINNTRANHIITLEDPIEFLHSHKKSIVSQREIQLDTESYVTALRAALRQSPDVILLGEMRDYETISVAMTAAETGHLLFSSLHTIGAANTINRIIDVFPAHQQKQIAVQLSTVLTAVVSQQLIPDVNGNIIPVFEMMTVTPAIRNMIRDGKVYQIDGIIYSSDTSDMVSMDTNLFKLYNAGRITKDTALMYSLNPEMMSRKLH